MRLNLRQEIKVQAQIMYLCFTNGWSFEHIRKVSLAVLHSNANTVRILLANASLLWAVMVILDPTIFDRPAYQIMAVLGGAYFWAMLFLLHFIGVYWRTYDPKARPVSSLIINGFGFLIWFFSSVSLNVYVGGMSPGTALELTMCGASAWALYKTGFGSEDLLTP